MECSEAMLRRYSVRTYRAAPVEEEKIREIAEAGRLAPTAKNLQPVRIRILAGEEMQKLARATRCTYGAPLAFVAAVGGACYERFCDGAKSYETDAAIVVTHMMLRATELGLGTCWVMAFDPAVLQAEIDRLAGYEPVAVLLCGYAAEDSAPSERHAARIPLSEFVL